MTRRALPFLALVVMACQGTSRSAADSTQTAPAASRTVDPVVPDTHVFDLADGTAVWLIPGRVARSADGSPCLERGVQLRRGALKILVPLLYTSTLPEVVDGKLVATLSNNCVLGDRYSIDLTTGQPTKLGHPAR